MEPVEAVAADGSLTGLTVALISAGVAFAVSLLFRWLDRERPVWLVEVDRKALPLEDNTAFVTVTVTNVGNGAAHDARIVTGLSGTFDKPWKGVLAPGEQLRANVRISHKLRSNTDSHGDEQGHELQSTELKRDCLQI